MERKIFAVIFGCLSALAIGMVLHSLKIYEAIIAIGFTGGFITGVIVKEKGSLYGQLPGIYWELYFHARSYIESKQKGDSLSFDIFPYVMYGFLTWQLIKLILVGALGGWIGQLVANRFPNEKINS